jgi:hypothetical protein
VRFPVFLQSGRPVPELWVLRIRRAPPRGDDEIRGSSAAWGPQLPIAIAAVD